MLSRFLINDWAVVANFPVSGVPSLSLRGFLEDDERNLLVDLREAGKEDEELFQGQLAPFHRLSYNSRRRSGQAERGLLI